MKMKLSERALPSDAGSSVVGCNQFHASMLCSCINMPVYCHSTPQKNFGGGMEMGQSSDDRGNMFYNAR